MVDFLKPTWAKITLFAVSSIVLGIAAWSIAFRYAGSSISSFWTVVLAFVDLGVMLPGGEFLTIVYSLLYWYLLSCLIVWSYRKVRRRAVKE